MAHSHSDVPEDEFTYSLDPPQRPVPESEASEDSQAPVPPAIKKKSGRAPVPPAVKKKSGIKKVLLFWHCVHGPNLLFKWHFVICFACVCSGPRKVPMHSRSTVVRPPEADMKSTSFNCPCCDFKLTGRKWGSPVLERIEVETPNGWILVKHSGMSLVRYECRMSVWCKQRMSVGCESRMSVFVSEECLSL